MRAAPPTILDPATLDARAAQAFIDVLRQVLARRERALVALVGGRSVGGIYRRLAAGDGAAIAWDRVDVMLADERLVAPDDPASNLAVIRPDLLDPLRAAGLPLPRLHPLPWLPTDPAGTVAAYNHTLAALGGRFDLVVLSAGEDGHVASLFPDHPSVRDEAPGFVLVEDSPKPPPLRASASRRLLMAAGFGLLVFRGQDKAAALQLYCDGSGDPLTCPARLATRFATALVLADPAAAGSPGAPG